MTEIDKLEELAKAADEGYPGADARDSNNWKANEAFCYAAKPVTILRLVRVARAAKVILAHHDEGARPDQIALDELRAALSVQNTVQVSGK
jgi:hypothetical protein